MISTLFIFQIILAILILITVLMQKSSSIGLGVYNSSNDSIFGAKGPAGFMAKLTLVLGLLFVINTISLVYLYNYENKKSIINVKHLNQKKINSDDHQNNKLQVPSSPQAPLLHKKD